MTNLNYLYLLGVIFLFGPFTTLKNNVEVSFKVPLKGRELDMGNLLRWSASVEENIQHFEVEKSTDGVDFHTIGTVKTTKKSGKEKTYSFLDTTLGKSKNYYRLKVVKMDGTSRYSLAIMINKQKKNQFAVVAYSNVLANNQFDLFIDAKTKGQLEYALVSYQGELIYEKYQSLYPGLTELRINLEEAMDGIYKIKLRLEQEEEILVIQKYGDTPKPPFYENVSGTETPIMVVKNHSINIDLLQTQNPNETAKSIRIIESPKYGKIQLTYNQSFIYSLKQNLCESSDAFKYQITVGNESKEVTIPIQILCEPLTIMSGMTPSIPLRILGISNFPNNSLYVFDDSGEEVFHQSGYTNDWNGIIKSGEKHLEKDRMYYYVFNDGIGNYYSGYIQFYKKGRRN